MRELNQFKSPDPPIKHDTRKIKRIRQFKNSYRKSLNDLENIAKKAEKYNFTPFWQKQLVKLD